MNQDFVDSEKFTTQVANKMRERYKGRVPVLIWRVIDNIDIAKRKFIVPQGVTMGQFLYILKKQIKNKDEASTIFLIIDNKNILPLMGDTIGKIYSEHNDNGFLKLTVSKENAFG